MAPKRSRWTARTKGAFSALLLATFLTASACGGDSTPAANTPANGAGGGSSEPGKGGAKEAPWEQIRDEDGIKVWRREVAGSPVIAFRGEGHIKAPMLRVASVLRDVTRQTEWVAKLEDAKELRKINENEVVTYTHIGTPFIMSDREFVSHIKIEFGPGKRVKINLHSIEDKLAPKTDYVRGQLHHSSFELTEVDANTTKVQCEIHADPKGSVPKWIVNMFQKSWAYDTLIALREQVAKKDIKILPWVEALFKKNKLI